MDDHNGNGAAQNRFAIGADPELSAQVRKELADTLKARAGIAPETLEKELAGRDIHAQFLAAFGELGLVPDTLPDLLAGHMIAMWSVVHDAPLPARSVAMAIAKQFAGLIGSNPLAADPAKRQLMGEALLYETVLTLEAQGQARASSDSAMLKQMAESAQRNYLSQNSINLRKTRLTESGMVRV